MTKFFHDNRGRLLGNVRESGNQKVYSDEKGRVVAFVHRESTGRERTQTREGRFVGFGDQGMRLYRKPD
jgi:hypothetical protein